jgi:hypothetical protein
VWGGVCDNGVWFAHLHNQGERTGGVGVRRGLCEDIRVRGGGVVTDGDLRVFGRGYFGFFCCGVDAGRGIHTWVNKDR